MDPTPADVLRVRQEAVEAAVRNGALAETVEVHVEVDTRRNLVRAVAVGTAELRRGGASDRVIDEDGRRSAAARSMQRDPAGRDPGRRHRSTGRLHEPGSCRRLVAAMATRGRATARRGPPRCRATPAPGCGGAKVYRQRSRGRTARARRLASWTSATPDARFPTSYVLVGSRLVNLSGLADEGQMLGLAGVEVRAHAPDQPVVIIATARNT